MGLLNRLLWPQQEVVIPSYEQGEKEDCIDLQIRSLLYMFKRCQIVTSKPFSDTSMLLKDSSNLPVSGERGGGGGGKVVLNRENEKLDLLYNKAKFDRLLYGSDEHRILIDWTKNKFRSLCILSGRPSELTSLPKFDTDHYSFTILSADSPDQDYIETLAKSDIYYEHHACIGIDTRRKIVQKALEIARTGQSPTKVLNKDDRALVIRYYLNKLATEVQVDRLYRGSLKAKEMEQKRSRSPVRTPVKESTGTGAGGGEGKSLRKMKSTPAINCPSSPPKSSFVTTRSPRSSQGETSPRGRSPSQSPSHSSHSPLHSNSHSQSPTRPHLQTPSQSPTRAKVSDGGPSSPPRLRASQSRLGLRTKASASNLGSAFNKVPDLRADKTDLCEEDRKALLSQARIAVKMKLDRDRRVLYSSA
uniref:ARAD1A11506p n=1 Tax=Blastobotrys adeninivorans TaxID=409370 RepID=A0A060SXR9_BLAAD